MTRRFLVGLHPGFGTYGVWLSQPGVDVAVAGPAANFILRSDIKYEQIVMSGQVAVTFPSSSVTVPLPADLVKHPYVLLKGNVTGNTEYPSSLGAAAPGGAEAYDVAATCYIYSDKLVFQLATYGTIYLTYMVFNRSVGS